ncbi:MAG: carbohydrate-binding domain-containing protein [Clostridia bacterium]|nr:carbohydrate-binding domain-containing protein [Clostridia bacterium]
MKTKIIAIIISVILLASVLAGCSLAKNDSAAEKTTSSETSAQAETAASANEYFTERDLDPSYEKKDAKNIILSGDSASSDDASVKINGSSVTITGEGVYEISGKLTDGSITVDAGESDKVQLVLSGAEITNSTGAAIYVKSADKVFITLADGTENTLSDTGAEYKQTDGEKSIDGVIFADSDLTLNGNGSLTVNAGYKHAIVSKKDLKITGGKYEITSTEKALEGENSIRICSGEFNIKAGDDALHADEEEDKEKGYIYISGGKFTIDSGDDGIHAVTILTIDGGSFDIKAHEGLEATQVIINDGTIALNASDDGINAAQKSDQYDPKVEINGGEITISMGQGDTDAIDSNGSIAINGGKIDITAQFPFDYETEGKINGGEVTVNGEKVTEMTNQFGGGMFGGKEGFGKREPMTDENGETLTRPDFKNFTNENGETMTRPERGERPQMGDGETPPEPPTDESGNPVMPGAPAENQQETA